MLQGHCFFNFVLEYATWTAQKTGGNKIGTHQLPVCAEVVNLLGDNIDTVKENIETLIDASREVGLEVNIKESKFMLLSSHQNAGQIVT
jgi:hypothetical protein